MAAHEDGRNQGDKQVLVAKKNRLRALGRALAWALVLAVVWALVLALAFGALGMGPVGALTDAMDDCASEPCRWSGEAAR